jgi:hypothetical protein
MNDVQTIELGMPVRDKVTPFRGIVTGKATYLYGSTRILVQTAKADNTGISEEWIDEGRLEVVDVEG